MSYDVEEREHKRNKFEKVNINKMAQKISKATKSTGEEIDSESYSQMPLVKINFLLMGIAALMIIVGFILISGGAPADADTFNPEVFSTRRIVVGPTITFLGFIFMGVGIMWPCRRNKKGAPDSDTSDSVSKL